MVSVLTRIRGTRRKTNIVIRRREHIDNYRVIPVIDAIDTGQHKINKKCKRVRLGQIVNVMMTVLQRHDKSR